MNNMTKPENYPTREEFFPIQAAFTEYFILLHVKGQTQKRTFEKSPDSVPPILLFLNLGFVLCWKDLKVWCAQGEYSTLAFEAAHVEILKAPPER
jgi:hypothetical protein